MASHTSVIVNHRVALPGTKAHGSIATHRLDYVRTRLGAVREPTDDDVRRQEMLEREDALGYISHRHGAVLDEAANCALFDAGGVADYRSVKAELTAAEGAILTSVVTVRREDAEELGLQTKQDFERFLRANWSEHLEQMGVVEPQDVRWVAAFHTNSEKNFHAHIISWDVSGRFDSLIPKAELEQARQDLVAKAMAPARQAINDKRMQARDGLALDIREGEVSEGQRRAMMRIVDELPESGSLKYGRLAEMEPKIKAKVDALVEQRISESPKLAEKLTAYEEAVERHADLKGLRGTERAAYKAAAMDDLKGRLGNAQLKRIKREASISDAPRSRKAGTAKPAEDDAATSPRDRKRTQVVEQEIASCLSAGDKAEVASALAMGEEPPRETAERIAALPSIRQYGSGASGLWGRVASGIARAGQSTGGRGRDLGDETGGRVLNLGGWAVRLAAKSIYRAIREPASPPKQNAQRLKEAVKLIR